MATPEQGGPSALLIGGAEAIVGSAACPAVLPCSCPDMAVAGALWPPDITMPDVITCVADEAVGPIATATVSW
ncbi:hypothetical protein ABZ568_11705 [Streptomyces olindensis]|uniref:Uncharacterized protein n=1 Tax=Streptomyces olindensis TaxID=358823 RepID=A0ABV2XSV1_9ACTN